MYLSKRSSVYYIWYRDQPGKKQKVSTHCRKKGDAFEVLRSFQASSHRSGNYGLTLSTFYAELSKHLASIYRPSTVDLYKRSWDHLLGIVGNIRLSGLTAYHFDRYKTMRSGLVGVTRVNMELRTLRAALGIAVRWKMLASNPFSRQPLISVPQQAPVIFSPSQIHKLLTTDMSTWLRSVIIVGILTGMRRDEMLNMRCSQIDRNRGFITIQSTPNFRTKTGRLRTIPIIRVLRKVLATLSKCAVGEYVIHQNGEPIKGYNASVRFKRMIRKLDMPEGLHLHSLRHSFASWLALDGESIYQISKLLGHSGERVTQQFYAHLQPEHLRDVIDRIVLPLR